MPREEKVEHKLTAYNNLFSTSLKIGCKYSRRKYYCYHQNAKYFPYCDSNIGLFFIAPYLVIALQTLVVALNLFASIFV